MRPVAVRVIFGPVLKLYFVSEIIAKGIPVLKHFWVTFVDYTAWHVQILSNSYYVRSDKVKSWDTKKNDIYSKLVSNPFKD